MESTRDILGPLSPTIYGASPDTDLFSLSLDFLLVFGAVKSIQAAMGLKDQLAPLHFYVNPTIAKSSAALTRLAAEAQIESLRTTLLTMICEKKKKPKEQ